MPPLAVFPKGFIDDLCARRMSLFKWLELAPTLDVDGVELYPHFFESFDAPYVRRARDMIEKAGLKMPMMCNSPDFTIPEPEGRAKEVEWCRRVIDLTAELGGQYTRVLSGQNRPGLDPKEALRWVVGCIEELIPHAEKAGIILTIENHYKDGFWEYPEWAQAGERYCAILDAIRTPRFVAQYDPSNAVVAGEDPYELLEKILPRVGTMQASDRFLEGGTIEDLRKQDKDPKHGYATILKHGVIGRGLNDYDRIFGTLAKAGYKGWVSIEDGEGPTIEEGMANLKASAEFLRKKLAEHFKDA